MRQELSAVLRCPECGEPMVPGGKGSLRCDHDHEFHVVDGIPDLVHPRTLLPSDAEFRGKYDSGAQRYDTGMRWLFGSFYEDEERVRSSMADLLRLQPGARVLEISTGSGSDSVQILRRIGSAGWLVATDLSRGMLQVAQERLRESASPISFVQCNGSYLPFADGVFDAVFHFGGINEFSERNRAIAEMARVTKIGGRVVFGDESVPPWLRETTFGRVLMNANKLYKHVPPLEALPQTARNVQMTWTLGGVFYLIAFDVGSGPPLVDLDLPIPGKGDSLRSRFEAAFPGETL